MPNLYPLVCFQIHKAKHTPIRTTNSVKFDIAVGTGYNFKLSQDLLLGSDLIAYIPLSNTYDTPGVSNSVFTLKLGASLKFKL